eukprot:4318476-Pyramimonas_sp.AAC.1
MYGSCFGGPVDGLIAVVIRKYPCLASKYPKIIAGFPAGILAMSEGAARSDALHDSSSRAISTSMHRVRLRDRGTRQRLCGYRLYCGPAPLGKISCNWVRFVPASPVILGCSESVVIH